MTARRDATHPPEKQALKREFKALIKAVGGLEEAAKFCPKSVTQLSAYGNINMPEFAPVDVVADLEAIANDTAGDLAVTRMLARLGNAVMVKLPAVVDCSVWHSTIGAVSKETGEAVQCAIAAVAGGTVTPETIREIDEAIDQLVALRALAQCGEA